MNINHWSYRFVFTLVGCASFFLGFNYAASEQAKITDIGFSTLKDHTSLTITADNQLPVELSFSRKTKTLTITLPDTTSAETLKKLADYSGPLVESVSLSDAEAPGPPAVKIRFRKSGVSYYKTPAPGGRGVVLSFRAVSKPLRIAGVTPEKLLGGARVSAPVSSPDKPPVAEKPALDDTKLFAGIDEKFKRVEAISGRDKFLEFMKKSQKREFEQAVALADEFLSSYPESIYREKVMFSRAENLYLMAKRKKSLAPRAISAYNEAQARYPESSFAEQAQMHKGNLYLDEGLYIEALTEYGGMLGAAPNGKYNVAGMLARARIFMYQKKYGNAYNELEKILVLFPNRREVRDVKYMMAESYFDRGKYKTAKSVFSEAQRQWPTYPKTHPATFSKIAQTNYKLGDVTSAVKDWFSIINLFPSSAQARRAMLRLGDAFLENGKKRDSAKIYERIIQRYPKNDESVMARMRLASLGARNPELLRTSHVFDYNKFKTPFATLDEIMKKYPPEKFGREALTRKGKAYAIQKRYISSIIAFKELLRSFPAARMSDEVFNMVRENFLNMIKTFHDQDGFFIALVTYYNNFDPFLRGIKKPGVLLRIADSFGRMTLYDRAIEYYRLANRFDTKGRFLPQTAFLIAKATLEMGNATQARRMLQRYLREFPHSRHVVSARHLLGDALKTLNQPAEALTEWRLAVEKDQTDPRTAISSYYMGRVYKDTRQYFLAVDSFNRAIASYHPGATAEPAWVKESYYQLAETYYLEGDYPAVILEAPEIKKYYKDDERNTWLDYLVSSSYERINRSDLAMKGLKKIADDNKTSPVGKVALARIIDFEWKRKNQENLVN